MALSSAGEVVLGDKPTPALSSSPICSWLQSSQGLMGPCVGSGLLVGILLTRVGQKTGQVGGLELLEDKEDPQE